MTMITRHIQRTGVLLVCIGAALSLLSSGCAHFRKCGGDCPERPAPPPPLGTLSDPIWQQQERNAEASDFVVHQHEFESNTARLNRLGETHLKQIAVRCCKTSFPVLVEPSMITRKDGTDYGYPIHPNPELDRKRRNVVVHALLAMGVPDAEERVVISPALAPGFEGFEAERSYHRGFGGFLNGFGGFGGFGGGFGGFGGFGGGLGFF